MGMLRRWCSLLLCCELAVLSQASPPSDMEWLPRLCLQNGANLTLSARRKEADLSDVNSKSLSIPRPRILRSWHLYSCSRLPASQTFPANSHQFSYFSCVIRTHCFLTQGRKNILHYEWQGNNDNLFLYILFRSIRCELYGHTIACYCFSFS